MRYKHIAQNIGKKCSPRGNSRNRNRITIESAIKEIINNWSESEKEMNIIELASFSLACSIAVEDRPKEDLCCVILICTYTASKKPATIPKCKANKKFPNLCHEDEIHKFVIADSNLFNEIASEPPFIEKMQKRIKREAKLYTDHDTYKFIKFSPSYESKVIPLNREVPTPHGIFARKLDRNNRK